MEFPKWKYHATKPAKIVHSSTEEAALGGGWVNSPAHVADPAHMSPEPAPAPKTEEKAELAPASPPAKEKLKAVAQPKAGLLDDLLDDDAPQPLTQTKASAPKAREGNR
jgi:hypothetical protein